MDGAKPGHTVKFQGLKGAAHLNGTDGTLVKYIKKEGRWSVRCESNGKLVNTKPENLMRKYRKAKEEPVKEISDEDLFKKPPDLGEEGDCPICFIPLDFDSESRIYKACCGKEICIGCSVGMRQNDTTSNKEYPCAFCRTPYPIGDREHLNLKMIQKRIDANDPVALFEMGYYHREGKYGVTQSYAKSLEYTICSAQLGYPKANYGIGCAYFHGDGVKKDEKKYVYYWSLAAMQGYPDARYGLAAHVFNNDHDIPRAMKHYRIAAETGCRDSMATINSAVMKGYITREERNEIQKAHDAVLATMKSEQRDKARRMVGVKTHEDDPDRVMIKQLLDSGGGDELASMLSMLGMK